MKNMFGDELPPDIVRIIENIETPLSNPDMYKTYFTTKMRRRAKKKTKTKKTEKSE